jgi:hypothetical protein
MSNMNSTNKSGEKPLNGSDAFRRIFNSLINYDLITLKLQTNGLPEAGQPLPSILAISALKDSLRSGNGVRQGMKFERFYFPTEILNPRAVRKNGLDEAALRSLRQGCGYPEHFNDDLDSFLEFCDDVFLFVGFNITAFDATFLPFLREEAKIRLFDLMTENRDILCTEWNEQRNEWKLPNIFETAKAYGFDFDALHPQRNMEYVKLYRKIFDKMRQKANVRLPKIEQHLTRT